MCFYRGESERLRQRQRQGQRKSHQERDHIKILLESCKKERQKTGETQWIYRCAFREVGERARAKERERERARERKRERETTFGLLLVG